MGVMVINILISISISTSMLISNFAFANYPVFQIQEPWEFVQSKDIPQSIEMTFVKKIGEAMPLSITFAREKTNRSQEDYANFILDMYQKNLQFKATLMGKIGKNTLLEIKSPNARFGPMKIWQLLQVVEGTVYVLTLSGPSKGFEKNEKEFLQIMNSFHILKEPIEILSKAKQAQLNELIDELRDSEHFKQAGFQSQLFQENEWLSFKKQLIKEFSENGPIWQLQLIAYLSHSLQND